MFDVGPSQYVSDSRTVSAFLMCCYSLFPINFKYQSSSPKKGSSTVGIKDKINVLRWKLCQNQISREHVKDN